jgi:uncharacterized protein
MAIQSSCLSYPISADRRGTLATIHDLAGIVRQSIISIIETRQGARVMLPDYGIPDLVFSVVDAGFAERFAYYVGQQVKNYEPLVESVQVRATTIEDVDNPQAAAISVAYTVRGSNVPRNLVYPVWRLGPDAQGA